MQESQRQRMLLTQLSLFQCDEKCDDSICHQFTSNIISSIYHQNEKEDHAQTFKDLDDEDNEDYNLEDCDSKPEKENEETASQQ